MLIAHRRGASRLENAAERVCVLLSSHQYNLFLKNFFLSIEHFSSEHHKIILESFVGPQTRRPHLSEGLSRKEQGIDVLRYE